MESCKATNLSFGSSATPWSHRANALMKKRQQPGKTNCCRLIAVIPVIILLLTFFRPLSKARRFSASMAPRDVKKVVIAREQSEGVGARVRRSIGRPELPNLDPFLLLDEFHVRKPAGFPDHPHRGQQTVTYMLEGAFKHEDNKGHSGTIGVGDLQWMTAGRGIVHSEMPATDSVNVGLQLWVNLAAKHKMTKPEYQELLAEDVPLAKSPDGNVEVKVIAGRCYNVESQVFTQTPTLYWDVRILNGGTFEEVVPAAYNTFMYVLEGKVRSGRKSVVGEHGACFVFGDGDSVRVESEGKARFVVLGGQPLNEPVVQHGPFVMNTQQEILQAIRDYSAGGF